MAVLHLPGTSPPFGNDFDNLFNVQAGFLAKVNPLGEALDETGDADLVDHLGELAGADGAHQADHAGKGVDDRLRLLEGLRLAAAHDGEHAVLGTGLATGHRRVDEAAALAAAASASSRATSAEAVVLSIRITPDVMPDNAPSAPIVTERRSSSLPTQVKTKSASRAASAGVAAAVPNWATHFSALAAVRL